jgi:hypothetical protein
MKRKAEPASLEEEEEDPKTGDILRKSAASSSITSSSDQFERRRKWRKSDLDFQSGSAAKALGSMLEVIDQAKEGQMLTVLAGEHEDNADIWQECEKLGRKYRAFYLVGERRSNQLQGTNIDHLSRQSHKWRISDVHRARDSRFERGW